MTGRGARCVAAGVWIITSQKLQGLRTGLETGSPPNPQASLCNPWGTSIRAAAADRNPSGSPPAQLFLSRSYPALPTRRYRGDGPPPRRTRMEIAPADSGGLFSRVGTPFSEPNGFGKRPGLQALAGASSGGPNRPAACHPRSRLLLPHRLAIARAGGHRSRHAAQAISAPCRLPGHSPRRRYAIEFPSGDH